MHEKSGKISRVLQLYAKLADGYVINKAEEAVNYGVNERSIQRDIDDIRHFLEHDLTRTGITNTIVYDRISKGYRMESVRKVQLKDSEVLALCKILLDSRAFTKEEMVGMIERLITCCLPGDSRKIIKDLIRNEEYHYVEPRHKSSFLERMWDVGMAIRERKYLEIEYYRVKNKKIVKRKIKPAAIMFSEYYFYVMAFIDDKEITKNFDVFSNSFPTIYRMDRIKELRILDERFHVPYRSRFEEGEFRKRVQFMYGGKLQKVRFKYSGDDIDSVLDRLPTAKVLNEENGVCCIEAEVFGKGINMWIRSQGNLISDVEYKSL